MTLNLSSLGDCSSGVCVDTSGVPILTDQQLQDLQNLPSQGGPALPQTSPGVVSIPGCLPQGSYGPLAPGQAYCPAPPPSSASTMPWGTLAAVLGGLVVLSAVSGRRG